MNILIDAAASQTYHSTGIGAYAAELIRAIAETPAAKSIALLGENGIYPMENAPFGLTETRNDFWEIIAKRERISDDELDIYHNLHNGIGMARNAKHNIVTIHDMIPFALPQFCGSPYRELFWEQTRASAEHADAVITVSEHSKKDILRFTEVPEDRIHVIHEAPKHRCNPLPETITKPYLRSRYGIRPPFFLYVGGFNGRKNVAGLIRGYAAVYRDFPKTTPLVIVGKEGHRRAELERLAEELSVKPYLRFPGYVPDGDLPFFYNLCEALIYPSFYEGFGLPPLEAAACGAAVIVSRRSSLPEIMGNAALYADTDEDIGKRIASLAADAELKNEMRTKAFARAAMFSYADTAKKTLAVYEKICRHRSEIGI